MTATTMPESEAQLSTPHAAGELAWIFAKHLLALYIPGITLLFLFTGPHSWYVALLFMVPMALSLRLDVGAHYERRQPGESIPAWPFDLLVYTLVALQLLVVWETVQLFRVQSFFSFDMLMVNVIVGTSSGFSIIAAHELIHRRSRLEQGLGRLLLCTTLYEHFYTEHIRGHHIKVGTPDDPATAQFGQSYERFFRATVPAQFRSAWRIEKKRLGDPDMKLMDPRMLHNRMLHGLAFEWSLAFAVFAAFGFVPFFAFLLQAFTAVRLLEAVNYFEHWGLMRAQRRVRPVDSWDTHSWFTYYGLTGLSRHADHHAYPARPYQQLRVWEEAPILPHGYIGTADMVMSNNAEFQRLAAVELGRRRLGPFAPELAEAPKVGPLSSEQSLARLNAVHAEGEEAVAQRRGALATLGRAWKQLPAALRGGLFAGALLLVLTTGIQWETQGAWHYGARLLQNGWILVLVLAVNPFRRWLGSQLGHEFAAWTIAFLLLAAVGYGTDLLLR
jgi:alkane 1-monooxygenase